MYSIEQINYIEAPAATIYKALTTAEGLGQVWTRKLEVKPELGFVNVFDFDEGYLTKMEVTDLQADTLVTWKCVASDQEWVGTGISFELTEEEKATKVRLNHHDWRELTDYYRWCSYNWAMFLFRLKKYTESLN